MSLIINTIPKDLPKTNPLLFSFLMIVEALELNIRFDGKYSREMDKDLPCFQFAVNSWNVVYEKDADVLNGNKMIEMQIVCAIWTSKPETNDCAVVWTEYPNGDPIREKPADMSYKYDFELWRNSTFDQLERIISLLVYKTSKRGIDKKKVQTLADIYDFEIVNDVVDYVYAKESTSNQFYGVGATFRLQSKYINCCPIVESSLLDKNYFESLGFVFDN